MNQPMTNSAEMVDLRMGTISTDKIRQSAVVQRLVAIRRSEDGSLRLVETGQVVRDTHRRLEHERQERDVTRRNDLVTDHVPAIHRLGELRNRSGEVDRRVVDLAGLTGAEEEGRRLAEAEKPVLGALGHDSSPSVVGGGAATPTPGTATLGETVAAREGAPPSPSCVRGGCRRPSASRSSDALGPDGHNTGGTR